MVGGGQWPPGEWTDDTGMALCVAEGILACCEDPVKETGRCLLDWGSMAKDVGGTVGAALAAYRGDWSAAARRTPQALALCLQAVEHADYSRAYTLMSRLTLPGESYFGVLRRIHRHLKPATYLEIGVARWESLALALPETDAIGIDPDPQVKRPLRARERIFATTSDEFFAQHQLHAAFG